MARGQSHGLGMGKGSIIDQGGGIIEYRQAGKLIPAFKVNVGDVTGFSVRKATKQDRKNGASALQQVIVLQGGVAGRRYRACIVCGQPRHGREDRSLDTGSSFVWQQRRSERSSASSLCPGRHR